MIKDWNQARAGVLIVGAGLAGCRAAMEAHDMGADVLLVTNGPFLATGSSFHPIRLGWGRGYTAGLGINGSADTPAAHLADMLRAGQGLADERLAHVLAEEAPARFRDLENYGVVLTPMSSAMALDVNDHGRGTRGALALDPDNLRATFRNQIAGRGIPVRERSQVVALLGQEGRCHGAVLLDGDGTVTAVQAKSVILATGGPNDLFLYNLNTPDLNGACHVMALDLGARLINIEFFQVILGMTRYPRAGFAEALLALHPRISNRSGQPLFADAPEILDARARTGPFSWDSPARVFDLLLARELRRERASGREGVTVDFGASPKLDVPQTIANRWRTWAVQAGVDFSRPVEIAPCVHACNGGIWIDEDGATGVANLFACGEIAGGPHGANRIGGNQFSASQVFGKRAGGAAARAARDLDWPPLAEDRIPEIKHSFRAADRGGDGVPAMAVRRTLQETLWQYAMFDRCEQSLRRAQAKLAEIQAEQLPRLIARSPGERAIAAGLRNAVQMGHIIVQAALLRQESRGPHYRTDFAFTDKRAWHKPIVVSRAGNGDDFACRLASDEEWEKSVTSTGAGR